MTKKEEIAFYTSGVLLWVLVFVVMGVLVFEVMGDAINSSRAAINWAYERGSIDAHKDFFAGKLKYELVNNPDGTKTWEKVVVDKEATNTACWNTGRWGKMTEKHTSIELSIKFGPTVSGETADEVRTDPKPVEETDRIGEGEVKVE